MGMGKDFVETSAAAREMAAKADEVLGFPISKIMFEGPDEELTKTSRCQPALYLHGLMALALIRERLPALKPVALDLVRQHQTAGDQVLIVTATNEFVTRPIADAFGVAELIAVELERDPQTGWVNGNIQGVPSAREGKVTRMEQWLARHSLGWQDVETTFYTDSINDLALMEKVDHPVATNPDERLRAVAIARGWRILELW